MEKRGLILVMLTAIVSGFSIFINKFSVASIDSTLFTFSKNILVAIFLISIIMLTRNISEIKELTKKQWGKLVLIGLVGGSIPFIMFFRGLQLSSGVNAAFIHKMMFIFVAVGAFLFLKEKISRKMLIGASLLLIGNALLLKFAWAGLGAGELLVFGATLLWATEQLISKNTLKELSGNTVAFGRMFFGSIFIMIFMAFTGKISLIPAISSAQLGWVAVTSIFLLLYVTTWYNGLKLVPVSVATPILLLGSVITTTLHFAFSGATVTAGQAAGMLMILIGVVFVTGYANITDIFRIAMRSKDER